MSDKLTEAEIFRIATIISEDAEAVRKKEQIYFSVGLPSAELDDLKTNISLDKSGSFGFFSRVLGRYMATRGSEATVTSLIERFIELNLGRVVDKIHRRTQDNPSQQKIWFEVEYVSDSFTGREDKLKELHDLVTQNSKAPTPTVINQVSRVAGLGGIGKTTLARKYAYQYSEYYGGNAIWINSETNESFRASLTRLHKKYFSTTKLESNSDEELIQMVYNNISKRKERCLIIFDNVEEFDVLKLLPKHPDVFNPIIPNVLITSRRKNWISGVSVLSLDVLRPTEATQLLKYCLSEVQHVKDVELIQLAESLQRLPLALQQAAAYIRTVLSEDQTQIKTYLKLFNDLDRCQVLLEYKTEDLSEHDKTVFHSWAITLDNIRKREYGPIAIQIMNISSFFQPENIPSAIFFGINKISGVSSDDDWSEICVNAAIALLKAYSMICGSAGVINIHRLVQRVVQLKIKIENNSTMVLEQGLALMQLFLKNKWTHSNSTFSHADFIWRQTLNQDQLIRKYVDIVFVLCEADDGIFKNTATDYKKHILRVFYPNHENTIRIQYYAAKELFNRVLPRTSLKILEEIRPLATAELGLTHELTERIYELTFTNLNKQKKYKKALKAAEELEALRVKKYGPEHDKTLHIIFHKASVLSQLEKVEKAQRVKNLAEDLIKKGEYDEAVKLFRNLLEMRTGLEGAEYECTFDTMKDLAEALMKKGELGEAVELLRTLEARPRVKGAEGSKTLEPMNLADDALMKRGELDEAVKFLQTRAEVRWRVVRAEDGENLDAMKHLTDDALVKKGELDGALKLIRTRADVWTKLVGAEFSETLWAMKDLSEALMKKGELNEAVELLRTLVEVRMRVKGAEYERTLYAMKDLVGALVIRGELDEALSLCESIYETIPSTNFLSGEVAKLQFMDDINRSLFDLTFALSISKQM